MRALYHQICNQHGFPPDRAQITVLEALEKLGQSLEKEKKSFWNFWRSTPSPQGLYIYGDVGRGKTMLMDLFFQTISLKKKQRVHFHTFMQHVHERLKELRDREEQASLLVIAKEWAEKANLLCFDEFHITNIADAMILERLFKALFQEGITIIATSNFAPKDLYPNGLHRERLFPFMELLEQQLNILSLESQTDYRRKILENEKCYFSTSDTAKLNTLFEKLTQGLQNTSTTLDIQGRPFQIRQARGNVACISFKEACEENRGRGDYLELTKHYSTIFLENVPIFDENNFSAAQRFITLIDILYDQNIKLILSAEALPDDLYQVKQNADLFTRTASRLIEMTGVNS